MVNRYINKDVQPLADVLNIIANVLNTTVDFLINGNRDDSAKASIKHIELLKTIKEIDAMPDKEQNMLLHFIHAYLNVETLTATGEKTTN